MLVTETPASKMNISQYLQLDDLHSTTNEIYLSYFTLGVILQKYGDFGIAVPQGKKC